ncbi:MAG TPA: ABC transporter substrate-binding protein [Clostridiales bacterium]|nr:ABC transporter substrate-binding protein [Clostridiales bacterium]
MKKYLALLLALCMVFALAACGGDSKEPEPTSNLSEKLGEQDIQKEMQEGPEQEETYTRDRVVLAWNSVTSLSPWGTRNSTPGNYEVYEMLYECDANGEMYPLLADATYNGNFMPGCDHEKGTGVYTVKIYDYIKDHKGRPVTAHDVAYSYMYQLNNESTSGWKDNLLNVEAEDDTTVVFTFAQDQTNVGQLLNILCRCFIVNEESHKESASALANEMIGTGPYKFKSYTSGSELILERNEDYWQTNKELRRQEQQANVETIVYKFIDEASQKVIGLKTGEIDFAAVMSAKDIEPFLDGGEFADRFNVFTYPQKFVFNLAPNCSDQSIMGDINMRLAVFNAIDQDALVAALGGTDTRIYSYASAYYSDFDWVDYKSMDNYNTRTSVDPDVVKGYLEKAGYKGEKVILLSTNSLTDATNVIEGMLLAQGINVEAKILDDPSANALLADPAGWDIMVGMMAGDYNVTVWQHGFSYGNTPTGDRTMYHLIDDEWEDLLNLCISEDGHTPENMKAWWEHCVENAYAMGLYTSNAHDILPEDMTYYVRGDKLTPLTGASTYAAPKA